MRKQDFKRPDSSSLHSLRLTIKVSHKPNFLVYTETNVFFISIMKLRLKGTSLGLWVRKPDYEPVLT